MRRDQLAHHRHHAGNDLLLGVVAIGKEHIVGDIDIMRVRPQPHHLAQHREPAKAGIEHENRRSAWHGEHLIRSEPVDQVFFMDEIVRSSFRGLEEATRNLEIPGWSRRAVAVAG